MHPKDAYQELLATLREISVIDSIGSLLGWDEHTLMPPGGTDHRANQNALIAKLSHERFTSPRVDELLRTVSQSDLVRDPESDAAANMRETRRVYDRAKKLPTSLVEELAKTAVHAQAAWAQAKKKSDFASFEPWLDKTVRLKRQEASCYGYTTTPYDALLEGYEPGETVASVQKVFDTFKDQLVQLIGKITSSSKQSPLHVLQRKYPIPLQERFSTDAAKAIGYDFDAGRMDIAVHPFCSGIGPGDTRITTRYDENYFGDAFFSVLHEAGHALYEQGLSKKEHFGEAIAESISLGIHESQSRTWENLVGRSQSFWRHFFPKAGEVFGDVMKDVSLEQWTFAMNDVRPSFIRTDADETTYNLHVMLRFELEQALINGQLNARDIPKAWNDRMTSYLGLTPPDDAQGCLQDVHWSIGAIGYFSTYALGNLYGAQFFEQARKDLGDLDAMFARGDFAPLLGWLREKIHRHGKRYTARQLVKRVTGGDLSSEPLMRHLKRNAEMYYGVK